MAQDDEREVLDLGVVGDDPLVGGDDPAAPAATPAAPERPPRRRRLLLGAAVAVASLVLLLLVSPTRGQPAAAPPATPPTPSSVTSTPTRSTPVTSGTTASGTSTVLPPVTTNLHQRLLGVSAGWELFGRGDDVVVRIQPALGRVSQTPLPYLQTTGPVTFLAVRDRVLIRPFDVVPGYEVRDGRPAEELTGPLHAGEPLFPGPDPDHVWAITGDPGSAELALIRPGTPRPERSLPLPSDASPWALAADGAGEVLFMGVSGVYTVWPDGLHRITTGALFAAGVPGWLTVECDERYRCSTVLRDRSGHARVLNGATFGSGTLGGYAPPGVISPDATSAAVFEPTQGPAPALHLVDLRSGARHRVDVELSDGADGSALAWSPDSRWLFAVDTAGRLRVVDPRTGTSTQLLPDLPRLVQLSIRPAP